VKIALIHGYRWYEFQTKQKVMWEKSTEALNSMISHTFNLSAALVTPVKPDFLVMRLKAMCAVKGKLEKVVVQGVYDLFDKHVGEEWGEEKRESRVVLIGKGLDAGILKESFEAYCLVEE
jgi:G3E family GTPase